MAKCTCSCSSSVLLYSCAGASNVGQIANLTALKLSDLGKGALTCAIALGADLSGFVESARITQRNIIIDGCPVSCVRRIFERHGIINYEHHIVTEMGIVKGARQAVYTSEVALAVGKINETICKSAV